MRAYLGVLCLAALLHAGDVSLRLERDGEPMANLTVRVAGSEAVSDARGVVHLEGVPDGTHVVSVRFPKAPGPGLFGGDQQAGSITVQGGSLLGVRIEVPSPQTVSGHVTDASTGKPLAGAAVQIFATPGAKVAATTSREDGSFAVGGLLPGAYRVQAAKEGFGKTIGIFVPRMRFAVELMLLPPGKQPAPVTQLRVTKGNRAAERVTAEIELASGETLRIADLPGHLRVPPLDGAWSGAVRRIVFRDAKGWTAAIEELRPGRQWARLQGLDLRGTVSGPGGKPLAGALVLARGDGRIVEATAGDDGAFLLRGLDAGTWALDVADRELRLPAPAPAQVREGKSDPVQLKVKPALTLRGRVAGLAGGDRATVTCFDRSTTTGAGGSFVLHGVRPVAQVFLDARAEGYQRVVRTVAATEEPIELRIRRTGMLVGVIRDERDDPVAGALVTLAGRGFRQGRFATSDREGRFELRRLPAGTEIRIRVAAAGYAPALPDPIRLASRTTTLRKPIVLLRGVSVSGIVVDARGRPVAGVVMAASPGGQMSQPTGADGRFVIAGLAPGRCEVGLSQRQADQVHTAVVPRVAVDAPARGVEFAVRKRMLVDIAAGQGIAWETGVPRTVDRARRENRPILLAINALDEEGGNRTMAFVRYRDPALVSTSRPFLCVVASPSDHGDKTCERFGQIRCAAHKEVMNWALLKYSANGNLVSPQHVILAPDGTELFRQEYWIEAAVLRKRMEQALVKVSPRRALELAARTREGEMQRLAKGADPVAYVKSGDPLAAAVLLLLYEEDEDARWVEALEAAPKEAFGMVRIYLVDDDALVPAAKAIDSERGSWWERYHAGGDAPAPVVHDKKLAAALQQLKDGDRRGLPALLAALAHPVDGPEVRAWLAHLLGRDLGDDPAAWREELSR